MTPSSSIIALILAGGGSYLLYQSIMKTNTPPILNKRPIYDASIEFTPAMWNDSIANKVYWDNRYLDPKYKKGETIHYSKEALDRNARNAAETAFSKAHPYN